MVDVVDKELSLPLILGPGRVEGLVMRWVWGEGQGEGVGRDATHGTMGPQLVVFVSPVIDE